MRKKLLILLLILCGIGVMALVAPSIVMAAPKPTVEPEFRVIIPGRYSYGRWGEITGCLFGGGDQCGVLVDFPITW